MPDKYEPGSHNAIGIIGLSQGVQWVLDQAVKKLERHQMDLVRTFIDGMADVEGLRYFGPKGVSHRTGVFSVRVDGFEPQELSAALEASFGILTRSGLHCAPLAHQAIGTANLGGTTRLSFGPFLSPQDVNFATDALADLALSPGRSQARPSKAARFRCRSRRSTMKVEREIQDQNSRPQNKLDVAASVPQDRGPASRSDRQSRP